MKVQLKKRFPLATTTENAWELLKDVPAVASCMPGAEITESVDEHHHRGRVKVKIGPVSTAFAGDIHVQEINAEMYRVSMRGKGGDTKGSNASMDLIAYVEEVEGEVVLVGNADVVVGGKLASFGGRMMNQVADQILNQFGENFCTQVATTKDTQGGEAQTQQAEKPTNELNALRLVWSVIANYFKRLLNRMS